MTESPPPGVNTTPTLVFFDFSGLSGVAPSATATGSVTGKVRLSVGTPATKLVAVELNHDCPSDGARNPVLYAERNAMPLAGSKRPLTFQLLVLPKSL